MEQTIKIIGRILSYPFFLGLSVIGGIKIIVLWNINYIRYGGESIAYTDKMNSKTILDVYTKLTERQETKINNHITEMFNLRESYRKQFEWLKENYPEVFEALQKEHQNTDKFSLKEDNNDLKRSK